VALPLFFIDQRFLTKLLGFLNLENIKGRNMNFLCLPLCAGFSRHLSPKCSAFHAFLPLSRAICDIAAFGWQFAELLMYQ